MALSPFSLDRFQFPVVVGAKKSIHATKRILGRANANSGANLLQWRGLRRIKEKHQVGNEQDCVSNGVFGNNLVSGKLWLWLRQVLYHERDVRSWSLLHTRGG
jgi:hypothetical protein